MSQTNADCDIERVLPTSECLVREPCDQVGADIGYTRCLEPEDFVGAVALGVASADCGALAIDERLHAKADAIHSLILSFGEEDVRDLTWCSFEGDFGAGLDLKGLAERGEDSAKLRRLKQAGGPAAEVDGIYRVRKICLEASSGGGDGSDFLT